MTNIIPIFEFINDKKILIKDENTGKIIGDITSPSATIVGSTSAIQVCGFDYACQLWGCGKFGYLDKTSKNYHAKKDIQLLFTNYSITDELYKTDAINHCIKCYSKPCKCNELKIYGSGEYILEEL
jgi:hypothetical protein